MISVIAAFIVGLVLSLRGKKDYVAWLLSCCVTPAYVLFVEFVLPYRGASFWQIAIILGGIYGAIAGLLGVTIGLFILKYKEDKEE